MRRTRRVPRVLTAVAAVGMAAFAAACGSDGSSDGSGSGSGRVPETLTIYASLPLEGPTRHDTEVLSNGEKLALEEAGYRAGRYRIRFKLLSDASAQTGNWDVGQVSANARQALSDPTTIAYLGEFNSGATAVALPIINRGYIPQVTQSSSTGLTVEAPGTAPGEPDKYYPTGTRHIVRMTSRDDAQGVGLVELARQAGAGKLAILNDKEVYGLGLAASVARIAEEQGLDVAVESGVDPRAANFRSLADSLATEGVDAVVFAGCTGNNAIQLFKDLSVALPDAKLYGGDCLLDGVFYGERGGIPADVQAKTVITAQLLPPEQLSEEGRAVLDRYKERFGGSPSAYAVYGYESMKLVLDAIAAVTESGPPARSVMELRRQVLKHIYEDFGERESALGPYTINEDGDAAIPQLAAYRLVDNEPVFFKNLKPVT